MMRGITSIGLSIFYLVIIPTVLAEYGANDLFLFSTEWQQIANETNSNINFDAGSLIDERDLLRFIEGWRRHESTDLRSTTVGGSVVRTP